MGGQAHVSAPVLGLRVGAGDQRGPRPEAQPERVAQLDDLPVQVQHQVALAERLFVLTVREAQRVLQPVAGRVAIGEQPAPEPGVRAQQVPRGLLREVRRILEQQRQAIVGDQGHRAQVVGGREPVVRQQLRVVVDGRRHQTDGRVAGDGRGQDGVQVAAPRGDRDAAAVAQRRLQVEARVEHADVEVAADALGLELLEVDVDDAGGGAPVLG